MHTRSILLLRAMLSTRLSGEMSARGGDFPKIPPTHLDHTGLAMEKHE